MLAQLVPGPLVRFFARPYVAGDSMEEAFRTAHDLLEGRGLLSTLDLLGEDVRSAAEVAESERVHRELVSALASDQRFGNGRGRPSVSVKPSAFTEGPREAARGPLFALAAHAKACGVALTIDMEDRRWTDVTLDVATDLFRLGFDVGTVLQTRLNRTEADLAHIPRGMRVRLVIGIYPESPEVAVTDKRVMKERMIEYAERLLAAGARVEFATHDEAYLERFARNVAPKAPDRCEVQMLLGVPRTRTQETLRKGDGGPALPVRLYVPFSLGWKNATAYLRRRMHESPSMIWLVLRNLAHRG